MLKAIIALFILLLSLPASATQLADLPDPADALLSQQQAKSLGSAWLRQLRSRVSILNDPLVQEYCEHLIWQLLAYSGLNTTDLDLVVINTSSINAFAVPGGIIGLNAGTLLNADNEDEVAAVIAHELAHVSQHHFARQYTDNRNLNRSFLLALLASVALAATGHGEAGMAGLATTQAAAIQSHLAYSRHQEAEADRIGMQTLVEAGFNPYAMPAFFEKMMRMQRLSGEPPLFLMDHPATESRIADTRARASKLPRRPYHASLDFLLVRARLQALYIHRADNAEQYFRELYRGGDSSNQLAAGYGLAIASIRNKHYDQAEKLFKILSKQSPNTWWFKAGLAETDIARGDYAAANKRLESLLHLLPNEYALSVFYARSLLHSNQPKQAQNLLQTQAHQRRKDPLLWHLLAKAYGQADQPARAHLALGKYRFLMGKEEAGIKQLQYALDGSKKRFALHSRIKAQLKKMKAAKAQHLGL